jgi:ATP-dependent helicase/nuclease subunit B
MIRRHFLGWDQPVPVKIVDYLMSGWRGGPLDLSQMLVLVPTRQAGRRLRQFLISRCSERQGGLFPPRIETPSSLVSASSRPAQPIASPSDELCCWIEVLLQTELDRLTAFFPVPPGLRDFSWALRTGRILQSLRDRLVEGGWSFSKVADLGPSVLEEPERWADLKVLEEMFETKLFSAGKSDFCRLKIENARRPVMPEGIKSIVLAALPDPIPLAVQALDHLSRSVDIDILIHAPPEVKEKFDAWGRPLPEMWQNAVIDLEQPEERLVLCASPQEQSRAVLELLGREQHHFKPSETGLGVTDPALAATLVNELKDYGITIYDPAGIRMRKHGLAALLEEMGGLLQEGSFAALGSFLRNADVLARLARVEKVPVALLLEALDRLQNDLLPQTVGDAVQRLPEWRGSPAMAECLRTVFAFVERQLENFASLPVESAVECLLTDVYRERQVDPRRKSDRNFSKAAVKVRALLEEFRQAVPAMQSLTPGQRLQLFIDRLCSFSIYPDHEDAAIELDGWLELPWLESPLLAVCGMNEGMVPSSRLGDPFLPDSLCLKLGLRSSLGLFGRDAFLLAGLAESRKKDGRLYLLLSKTSLKGEPLMPSRLLFLTEQKHLAERAALLFGEVEEQGGAVAPSVSFQLDVRQAEKKAATVQRLPVTAFRDYLSCPFRFLLKYVLGMEPMDDQKSEMDALDFGSLAHDAMQAMGEDVAMRQSSDAESIASFLGDHAEQTVRRRYGSSPPLQIVIQLHSLQQRLSAAARQQAVLAEQGWRIVGVERDLVMEVDGVRIGGRIDRIDRHEKSGRYRIIDYKTGEKGGVPDKVHVGRPADGSREYALFEINDRELRWLDLQLPLYFLLLNSEGITVANCEAGYFNLPKAVSETAYVPWADFSGPHLAAAERCMRGVLDDIRRNKFWPPSERVSFDAFADLFTVQPDLLFKEPFG